jgi:hypothetical protein
VNNVRRGDQFDPPRRVLRLLIRPPLDGAQVGNDSARVAMDALAVPGRVSTPLQSVSIPRWVEEVPRLVSYGTCEHCDPHGASSSVTSLPSPDLQVKNRGAACCLSLREIVESETIEVSRFYWSEPVLQVYFTQISCDRWKGAAGT